MITYRYYLTATLTLALMLGSCRAKKEERTEQSYHTEALNTEASRAQILSHINRTKSQKAQQETSTEQSVEAVELVEQFDSLGRLSIRLTRLSRLALSSVGQSSEQESDSTHSANYATLQSTATAQQTAQGQASTLSRSRPASAPLSWYVYALMIGATLGAVFAYRLRR